MTPAPKSGILVVCIGNELIADDAVGYEIWHLLQEIPLPETVRLEYAGVGGVALLDRLTGNERLLIVVDAVQFNAPAGTIHRLNWDDLPACPTGAISAHGIGLRETVEIGKLLYPEKLPQEIVLYGIEGRCFNMTREAMTPETEAVLGETADRIKNEIMRFSQGIMT
ncbi:putative hydrogenase maturation protease [Geobacter sp. OR-1]|uniref:hydrogenase maturation protease n=1 Tax=Geobacter sp. OR-1 TaxID=1266765 RepID=UPI000544328F|nr:hydrogenase maturation protease [Geobacter sp. OR-1]GAM08717.1 putative hydrogenase maturation protease [Geobacter sp. OR-1]